MFIQKLYNSDLENITGGQLMAENVMGVTGLTAVTGSPTDKNPEGIFWDFYGIALTKDEATKKLKKNATRFICNNKPEEQFLCDYINKYNNQVHGF